MLQEMPVSAKPSEADQIRALDARLGAAPADARFVLADSKGGTTLELPESLFRVLAAAARQLASGHSVWILHYDEELTTQQAADLLQVSRPYLIRLLTEGKIAYRRVGTHRRIRIRDVMKYNEVRNERRRGTLKELIRGSDTLGLYDDEQEAPQEPAQEDGPQQGSSS